MKPGAIVVGLLAVLLGALAVAGCTVTSTAQTRRATSGPEDAAPAQPASGDLIVYSATFAPTAEQSEYPVHTDYTIATTNGTVMERIANRTGPFGASPVNVTLPEGGYQVRAQYEGGQFVVVAVVIQAGKTTIVELDGRPLPQGIDATKQPVYLPNGSVVGWSETAEGSARSNR